MHNDMLYVGCAAGFSGDRTDAAGPVVDTLIADAVGPRLPDFRDAGRTHAGARADAPPRRPRGRLRAAARRHAASGAGALPRPPHSHRQQLRRGQPGRRGAPSRRWRANSAPREPRIAVVEGDDLTWPGTATVAAAMRPTASRSSGQRQRLHRRRSHRRRLDARAPTSSSAAASPTRRCGRAGDAALRLGADDWDRWAAPPWRGICSNAARRSAAATSPTRATRTCRGWRASASRSPRSMPTASCTIGKAEPRAAW